MYLKRIIILVFFILSISVSSAKNINIGAYRDNSRPDSVEVISSEEIENTESENDSTVTRDDEDTKWSLSASIGAKKSSSKAGADLTKTGTLITQSLGLEHISGFSLNADVMENADKTLDYFSSSIQLAYSFDISDNFSLDAGYTRSFFQSDTANIFASSKNQLELSLGFNSKYILASLDYSYYIGDDKISLISISLLKSFKITENFKIMPIISVSGLSYEVNKNKLVVKEPNPNAKTKVNQKFALSGYNFTLAMRYSISDNFSIRFSPSYAINLIKLISKNKSQLGFSLGIDYNLDF